MGDVFDVGRQHPSERGEWVFREGLCVTCGDPATIGSWCAWHHPSKDVIDDPHLMTVDELHAAVTDLQRRLQAKPLQ